MDPTRHGVGIGTQLIEAFCNLSASDRMFGGGYLETAKESNLEFYQRAGFVEIGRGSLGSAALWCMYRPHRLENSKAACY